MREGSDLFVKWSSPSEPPINLKIFLFEVLNPKEVEINSSRPIVRERGPYCYVVKSWKEILEFEDANRLMSYKEHRTYHFVRDKSIGNLDEEITMLNIPFIVRNVQLFHESCSTFLTLCSLRSSLSLKSQHLLLIQMS